MTEMKKSMTDKRYEKYESSQLLIFMFFNSLLLISFTFDLTSFYFAVITVILMRNNVVCFFAVSTALVAYFIFIYIYFLY